MKDKITSGKLTIWRHPGIVIDNLEEVSYMSHISLSAFNITIIVLTS